MARLFTSGFELQAFDGVVEGNAESGGGGSAPVISSTHVHGGAAAALFQTGAANEYSSCYWTLTGTTGITYCFRAYFYMAALPSGGSNAVPIITCAQSSNIATVQMTNSGTLILSNVVANSQVGSASAALSINQWYCVEMKIMVPASGNGTLEARINGTVFATSSSTNVGTTAPTSFAAGIGYSVGAWSLYMDDVAVNDSTGTAENGYPGPGSIVMLLPTADLANTGFTDGAGGTGDLWGALDHTPPVGVASGSATATSQIKDANSNTTDNYQPTMQTYTAAGIPSTASINLVQGVAIHGNGSASTGRTTGLSVLSNPVIAEKTANTSGTAGTYPTGWKSYVTTVSYSPAVTPGTAPVMEFRKGTATTNIIMAAFLGMMVEYSIGYFFVGAGTNWSSASSWSLTSGGTGGAGVPTALDDVIFDSHSGNCTIDTSAAVCCSIDCTAGTGNYTGTLTHTAGVTLTIGGPSVSDSAVAMRFSSGMTYTLGNTTTSAITFNSSSATQTTITSAGKTLGNITLQSGGSWLLVDGFSTGSTATVTLTQGTLNTNGQTCSWGAFSSNNSNTRTMTLGASNVTLTEISGTVWDFTVTTGLTFNAGTSIIIIGSASSSSRTLSASSTFHNLQYTLAASSGALIVAGTNTFNTITLSASHTLTLPASATTTITSLSATGTAGNLITINSSTPATQATLSCPGGFIICDYLSIQDSNATGGATFFAGAHSTNVSDNTGWVFTAAALGEFFEFM